MYLTNLPVFSFLFSLYLSVNGAQSRKLSPSGARVVFIVGFAMMSMHVRAMGVSLVLFYLLGSKATEQDKQRKAHWQLEAERHGSSSGYRTRLQFPQLDSEAGRHGSSSGYCTGSQFLCSSLTAFVACIVWSLKFTPSALPWSLLAHIVPIQPSPDVYGGDSWCPMSPTIADGLSRTLMFATLGQFACCLGDTLASKQGVLSNSPPVLITTFETVPVGTNGGISVRGTIASAIGGWIIGLAQFVSLVLENRVCRAEWRSLLPLLTRWGLAAGVFGSMLDSFLGATLQRTRDSTEKKWALKYMSVPDTNESVKVISRIKVLTNDQVDLLSSVVTALVVAALA